MLARICGACGKTVRQGLKCTCIKGRHKAYDLERRNKTSSEFYHSKSWRLLQEAIKNRADYVDEYIMFYNHEVVPGRVVHHIVPLTDDMSHALNPKNLIYVSDKTHRLIHDAYNKSDKDKREMQAKLCRIVMNN